MRSDCIGSTFLLAPRLLQRYGALRLISICLGATALRWLATALWPQSLPVLVVMQGLHALSFGIFHASCMQLATQYFPGRLGSHGQALLYVVSSGIGGVIGSGSAGLAWELGGGLAAFAMGAVASAAGLGLALRLRHPDALSEGLTNSPVPGSTAIRADEPA